MKEDRYSNPKEDKQHNNTKDVVFIGTTLSLLYLIIDVLSDRDHVERYHTALTGLISAFRQVDPTAVIA